MSSSSRDNTRMLPSISNLLISSPYNNKDTPTLNLSPASPILSFPSTPPTQNQHSNEKSPTAYLSLDNNVSPILSPISSPSSSPYLNGIRYLSLNSSSDPPLEGDDPPQRLRLPSPSLSSSSTQNNTQQSPISPKSLFIHNSPPWNNNTNKNIHHSPTPSCSSIGSSSVHSFEESIDTTVIEQQSLRRRSTVIEEQDPIPNTQIVFDASGQPILKRRRGRPPTCNTNFEGGGWTFLTPTVWDIHVSEEQKERELKADNEILARSKSIQAQHSLDDNSMTDSMNAFTNSNMDTLLQMPRKKRGRKPKTHIAGNSCFVWKDLTSTRTSTKK